MHARTWTRWWPSTAGPTPPGCSSPTRTVCPSSARCGSPGSVREWTPPAPWGPMPWTAACPRCGVPAPDGPVRRGPGPAGGHLGGAGCQQRRRVPRGGRGGDRVGSRAAGRQRRGQVVDDRGGLRARPRRRALPGGGHRRRLDRTDQRVEGGRSRAVPGLPPAGLRAVDGAVPALRSADGGRTGGGRVDGRRPVGPDHRRAPPVAGRPPAGRSGRDGDHAGLVAPRAGQVRPQSHPSRRALRSRRLRVVPDAGLGGALGAASTGPAWSRVART